MKNIGDIFYFLNSVSFFFFTEEHAMRKRGRPESGKVPFCEARLHKVLKEKGLSLRKIQKDESCDVSERTIRRACKSGEVTLPVLNVLSKYLNIDPKFLVGL